MGAQSGISPAEIDRCDLFSVLAMLGAHRHDDFWLPDHELAPDDDDDVDVAPAVEVGPNGMPRRRGRRPVSSSRGGTPGQQAREQSQSVFAARRAAARGEAPPPVAAPPSAGAVGVANLLTGGRVTGGD